MFAMLVMSQTMGSSSWYALVHLPDSSEGVSRPYQSLAQVLADGWEPCSVFSDYTQPLTIVTFKKPYAADPTHLKHEEAP